MTQLASPPPDVVSDVLHSLAVRSVVYCVSELRAPWRFEVADEPAAKFHLVLEGSALLDSAAGQIGLARGDLVVLPRGTGHALLDSAGSPAPRLDGLLAEHALDGGRLLRYGGEGRLTRLLCGGLSLAEGTPRSTLALLPEVLHVQHDPTTTGWLAPVLAALTDRAQVVSVAGG